jgi:pseudoazurin
MMTRPLAALFAALALAATPALAADHQVQMLNRGDAGNMVFEPSALHIQPGDTVTFVSVNPGHNAETIADAIPEGAARFRTAISRDETVNFEIPGVYIIKCTPHLPMGMVMVVQVGDDPYNLDQVKAVRVPPIAAQRLEAAYAELGL